MNDKPIDTTCIRPTRADDVPHLVEIARAAAVFRPVEITALGEVLGDYLKRPGGDGYHCHTCEDAGQIVGFTSHGPNTMTDRTWDLYWIAVRPDRHGRGIGSRMLRFVEDDIRRRGGRLLLIETSSLPSYDLT